MPVSSLTIVGLSSGPDAVVRAQDAAGMSVIVLLIAAGGVVAGGFPVRVRLGGALGPVRRYLHAGVRVLLDEPDRPPFPAVRGRSSPMSTVTH